MNAPFTSSGDIVADRRYRAGLDFYRDGDFAAAAAVLTLAAKRTPHWPSVWLALGRARAGAYDPAGAIEAFRAALRIDPLDAVGAGLELARIDAAATIDAAPLAYVEGLFNAYAADFDKALVERLGYSTPQQLAAMTRTLRGSNASKFTRVLDLGCGTGLAGEAFAADVTWLEGVDLSEGMLDEARSKGVYDDLAHADILSFLTAPGERYDLILAADVFIYFGELRAAFAAAAARLLPSGLMAFSVERSAGADYALSESLRFAHSPDYVKACINAAGLEVANMERAVLRKDRGADIEGLLIVAMKPAQAAEGVAQEVTAARTASAAKPN